MVKVNTRFSYKRLGATGSYHYQVTDKSGPAGPTIVGAISKTREGWMLRPLDGGPTREVYVSRDTAAGVLAQEHYRELQRIKDQARDLVAAAEARTQNQAHTVQPGMKVQQLIDLLQGMDPEAEVVTIRRKMNRQPVVVNLDMVVQNMDYPDADAENRVYLVPGYQAQDYLAADAQHVMGL